MRFVAVLAFLAALCSGAASATEITVVSGGAVRAGVTAAAAAYEAKTGDTIVIDFSSTPQIKKRLADGDVFDVVIAPPGAVAGFRQAGLVEGDGVVVGRVGAGVAVRQGAPVPTIATTEELKAAALAADRVVFNRASSGRYIEEQLKKLGVWDAVEPKSVRYDRSAGVMEHLLKGSGREIGFGPMTAILARKGQGLVLVGPLPPDIQKLRAYEAAAMSAGARNERAAAFIAFLGGPEGKPHFVAAGVE